ncbi:hypothetical protein K504DRAFT_210908 [Pleomassaria siparia CBS 279.74]|uniref:Uncharacterized protein n=1 Tax=Pleomassaria siparia CBS 279.74 TaxID=1314801 RepID=A0A6G1KIR1_9PLEO|nr:hypothetical protein K504DRAFT_210908 [Pleomassaria siparia CBS 279.74]
MTGNNRKGFFYLGGDERGTVDEGKHPTPPNEVNVEAMGPPAGFYEQESSIHPRGADQKTGKGKGKVAAPDLNLRKPSPNLATVSSHSEPSKTKTKNKKNKAQTTAESDKEPFSEQMCQVDHITSYYRSHPARPEPSPEKRAGFGKVSTNSILDDVHKYIKEKTISAKIQDLYTKQIQRNLPLKRTPITLQKLGETFDPRVDPILQRLENDDEDVPKAGEVPFV